MADFYALLEIPRRPLLDEAALKARFYEMTAAQHPDVAPPEAPGSEESGASGEFAMLTVGYRTLADVRTRLRHLLELEAPELSFRGVVAPEGVDRFFMEVGQRKQELEIFLGKHRATLSALSKALLLTEQYELQEKLEELLAGLTAERERWLAKLPELDTAWESGARPIAELARLAQALGYLDKWSAQLRDGLLQLQLLE